MRESVLETSDVSAIQTFSRMTIHFTQFSDDEHQDPLK